MVFNINRFHCITSELKISSTVSTVSKVSVSMCPLQRSSTVDVRNDAFHMLYNKLSLEKLHETEMLKVCSTVYLKSVGRI